MTDSKPKKLTKKQQADLERKHPLHVIRRAKDTGIREVLVSFSAGKESLACLELCVEHFERVQPFFMYVVKGLSFQEVYLRYIENRYKLTIDRIPHWQLAAIFRGSVARHATGLSKSCPRVTVRDIGHAMRKKHGIEWIVSGETCGESLQRTGMIKACDGISKSRGHIFPLAYWRRMDVEGFLSDRDIPLPPEYKITLDNRSFGGLRMEHIVPIFDNYPEDYQKIKAVFPLVDSQVLRWKAAEKEGLV